MSNYGQRLHSAVAAKQKERREIQRVRVEPKGPKPLDDHDPALTAEQITVCHHHISNPTQPHFRLTTLVPPYTLFLFTHLSLVPSKGAD
jgi:hypothetical protein